MEVNYYTSDDRKISSNLPDYPMEKERKEGNKGSNFRIIYLSPFHLNNITAFNSRSRVDSSGVTKCLWYNRSEPSFVWQSRDES